MKAAQIQTYGGPDVLQTVTGVPQPVPAAGQVLIEVHAAGVNPFDWKVREGYMKDMTPLNFPATLGGDFAGIVADVGQGVTDISVGDEVYGQANALGGQGSYAEFTSVKADSVGPKPKKLDFAAAAALPLAGVSAYQALVDHMALGANQRILIHGGAGGIASFAIPLAKYLGAHVATTAAKADKDYVKSLGADEVIDYENEDFTEKLKDFDAVYDTIGGDTYERSFQVLRRGGIIVSMVSEINQELADRFEVKSVHQFTQVTRERLSKLAALVENGAIKPQIDKVFSLDQAGEALGYIQSGKHHGKVVLKTF